MYEGGWTCVQGHLVTTVIEQRSQFTVLHGPPLPPPPPGCYKNMVFTYLILTERLNKPISPLSHTVRGLVVDSVLLIQGLRV